MKKACLAKFLALTGVSLALVSPGASFASENNILYIYNWTEYIPNSLLVKFKEQTGIEVRYSTYESNEEMYSKLKITNGEGYDLIFPSHYYVKLLVRDGYLQPLNKSKLHLANVNPEILAKSAQFDPNNTYTIPYTYGFTVIGVNSDKVKAEEITSWADLWKPKYKNLIMLNDMLDNFSVALLKNGVNPNKATNAQFEKAYKDLKVVDKKVVQYNSDSPELPYIEGAGNLGMIWTGSAFRAQNEELSAMKVVYPKEGAILWMDNFAIPSKAQNTEAAYKFINFILEPENSYEILKEIGYQTANDKLKDLLPEEWKNNPILYPPHSVIEKAIINDLPIERLEYLSKLWNKLKVVN